MRWCSCIGRWAGDGNNKDLVIAKIGNWVIEELSTHKFFNYSITNFGNYQIFFSIHG